MDKITLLDQKRIVLAATGSIAVYKAVDLASKLTQAGAEVDVVLTKSAQQFVAPLTFQSVTGRPVYTDLWQTGGGLPTHIAHVGLGEGADLFAVIPATAHTLAKLAHGFADDLLSVTALAARCPVMVAPAMDGGMYQHPATVANLETLRERGVIVVEPDEGRFASGLTGKGRLPDTPTLMGHMRQILGQKGVLKGRKLVVTAGGTREPLDPVRYLTNHSSGKQGFSLAQAAVDSGAEVVLISAAQGLTPPVGVAYISVESAEQMLQAVLDHIADADTLVMAAAVADYRPATMAQQKIKKTQQTDDFSIPLARNPDILLEVKQYRSETGFPRVVVGFAAESENLIENAQSKLERKGVHLLVANDITATDAGFGSDNNRVVILDALGAKHQLNLLSKAKVSEHVIARVADLLIGLP